jgi:hypothetical protein
MNQSINQPDNSLSNLDKATAHRLSGLSSLPVDIATAQSRLDLALGRPASVPTWHWWRPLGSIAAVVLIAVSIGWLLSQSGSPAVAAPLDVVQLHRAMVSGEAMMMAANSIEQANQQIAQQQADAPRLPGVLGATSGDPHPGAGAAIQSCCFHNVQGVLVAAVLMEYEGQAVTLVIADGKDFVSPMGRVIQRGERRLIGHQANGLEMVMANQDDAWLCVMGPLSQDKLADLAARIKF